MLDKKCILIGYSGHGYVVADTALDAGFELKLYAELKEQQLNPFKLSYSGFEGADDFLGWTNEYEFALGIGDNNLREKVVNLIVSKNQKCINVIHPTAVISSKASMGFGNYIGKNTSINAFAKIGNGCILNTGCIVEHECTIGDFVHIAPGAVLAGNVTIGNRSFIGANAVVKPGITIGDDVIIGAGAVVLNDVDANKKRVGNPSREI